VCCGFFVCCVVEKLLGAHLESVTGLGDDWFLYAEDDTAKRGYTALVPLLEAHDKTV
jgi:hypothetical protein